MNYEYIYELGNRKLVSHYCTRSSIELCRSSSIQICGTANRKQIKKLEEWLLYAVTVAEKKLGGGTGALKLRYVYDWFVRRFPWLAKMISFEHFSKMVDGALEQMKKMLESNKAAKEFVKKEQV